MWVRWLFDLQCSLEATSWHICQNPGPDGVIRRSSRMPNTVPGISRFPQGVTISQQRIESLLQSSIKPNSGVDIMRDMVPSELIFDPTLVGDGDTYPITVKLGKTTEFDPLSVDSPQDDRLVHDGPHRHATSNGERDVSSLGPTMCGKTHQIIHSKYVIGCDGAHSWTRKQLGVTMEGDQTDHVWGVIGKCNAQSLHISQTSLTRLIMKILLTPTKLDSIRRCSHNRFPLVLISYVICETWGCW